MNNHLDLGTYSSRNGSRDTRRPSLRPFPRTRTARKCREGSIWEGASRVLYCGSSRTVDPPTGQGRSHAPVRPSENAVYFAPLMASTNFGRVASVKTLAKRRPSVWFASPIRLSMKPSAVAKEQKTTAGTSIILSTESFRFKARRET